VRLRAIAIYDFRSIHSEQTLPLGNVTVLYGRNGSGKTNVLSAIDRIFVEDKSLWSESDELDSGWGDRHLLPAVRFELDAADVPGSGDRDLFERMLRDEFGGRGGESVLGDDETHRSLTAGASLEEIKGLMVDALVAGFDTPDGDRAAVAAAVLARHEVVAEALETWWVCDYDALPAAIRPAVARVASAAPDEDLLGDICSDLLEAGVANVEYLGDGLLESGPTWTDKAGEEHREPWTLARVVPVEYEAGGVDRAVVTAITAALPRMVSRPPATQAAANRLPVLVEHRSPSPGSVIPREWNQWIERKQDDGVQWSRLDPRVRAAADALGARATELLPLFARDEGSLEITVAELGD